jgi:hypothetical protein
MTSFASSGKSAGLERADTMGLAVLLMSLEDIESAGRGQMSELFALSLIFTSIFLNGDWRSVSQEQLKSTSLDGKSHRLTT